MVEVSALSSEAALAAAIGVAQSGVFAGDCGALIPRLPDASVDVVVTSPPYWGQRQSPGIGNENDPREYIAFLQEVFTAYDLSRSDASARVSCGIARAS